MDFATTMDALSWELYNRFVKVLIDYGIVFALSIFLAPLCPPKKQEGTAVLCTFNAFIRIK